MTLPERKARLEDMRADAAKLRRDLAEIEWLIKEEDKAIKMWEGVK